MRSLLGFVDAVGLRLENRPDAVIAAYDRYMASGMDPDDPNLQGHLGKSTGDNRRPTADTGTQLPIYFVGVWDTVGMLGIPVLSSHSTKRHRIQLPQNVVHARHALAIHDLRRHFPALPWNGVHPEAQGQTLEQVWFPGAHADVGGGYESRNTQVNRLSDAPLEWIAAAAESYGLVLNTAWPQGLVRTAGAPQLHSEITGLAVKAFGSVRPQLRAWRELPAAMLQTFRLHQGYLDQLVARRPPISDNGVFANARLDDASRLAFQMHVGLLYQRSPGDAPPVWLAGVQLRDLIDCRQRVLAFLTRLEGDAVPDRDTFERAFSVWVLCQGTQALEEVAMLLEQRSVSLTEEYRPLLSARPGVLAQLDLNTYKKWLKRVEDIIESLHHAATDLPSEKRQLVEPLAKTVAQQTADFRVIRQVVVM